MERQLFTWRDLVENHMNVARRKFISMIVCKSRCISSALMNDLDRIMVWVPSGKGLMKTNMFCYKFIQAKSLSVLKPDIMVMG